MPDHDLIAQGNALLQATNWDPAHDRLTLQDGALWLMRPNGSGDGLTEKLPPWAGYLGELITWAVNAAPELLGRVAELEREATRWAATANHLGGILGEVAKLIGATPDDDEAILPQLRRVMKLEGAPTAWAYDQACKALETHRERADKAEARIAELEAARSKLRKNYDNVNRRVIELLGAGASTRCQATTSLGDQVEPADHRAIWCTLPQKHAGMHHGELLGLGGYSPAYLDWPDEAVGTDPRIAELEQRLDRVTGQWRELLEEERAELLAAKASRQRHTPECLSRTRIGVPKLDACDCPEVDDRG